jgi:integrase
MCNRMCNRKGRAMASLVKIWITRYIDKEGRRVPKGTPGAKKVKERSSVWYGQYKDGGKYKRVPLFTDKTASSVRLAELVKGVERGEVGLINPLKGALGQDIDVHVQDYMTHLRTEGANPKHLSERERLLRAVLNDCGIKTLAELTADKINVFIANLQKKPTKNNNLDPGPASARTKDTYRGAVHAFAQWCVETRPQRLKENPVSATAKPKGEAVHNRRAETVENLQQLLQVAAERPLLEALTVRKGPRKGERYAGVRPEVRERLLQEGRERRLLYLTAILTGMRQGELSRLLVRHLRLTGSEPAVYVAPRHNAKNKTAIWLPLLPDHAAQLAAWVKDTGKGPDDAVLYVPEKPNKIFRRDLKAAGIDYRDKATGEYFDFHALRHCTATYLNAAGVAPSVVMLFMRHQTMKLSLVTYNDPRMTDARRALTALPKLL